VPLSKEDRENLGGCTLDELIVGLARAIIALFVVVDPIGNIPIFVGLTQNITGKEKSKVYNTATVVGVILLLVFAFTGQEIFTLFGLSIYSFEIAGGILLLIISIRILISGSMHENVESPETLGAVPIAMPLLVGPGAITTTIFNLQTYGILTTVTSVLAVLAVTWVILKFIDRIYGFLGKTGSVVIAKVMALLIAAIAIQYIINGVTFILK
jgi:multiple antibiotic resistance protein